MATYTGAEKFVRQIRFDLDDTAANVDQTIVTVAANSYAEVSINYVEGTGTGFLDIQVDASGVIYTVANITAGTSQIRDPDGLLFLGAADKLIIANSGGAGQQKLAHIVINEYQLQ